MKRVIYLLIVVAATAWADLALHSGRKTVTTAGTPVQLGSSTTEAAWVTLTALSTNTGKVCFGGSAVMASSENAPCLNAGDSVGLPYVAGAPYNLAAIWLDAAVGGEGVAYAYAQ